LPAYFDADLLTIATYEKTLIPLLALLFQQTFVAATAWTAQRHNRDQTLIAGYTQYSVRIPEGYALEWVTDSLGWSRVPTLAGSGDLFIGSRSGNFLHPSLRYTLKRSKNLPPRYNRLIPTYS
jgi:hypothetical protein